MNHGEKSTHYFLGANSGEGFVSRFDELDCMLGLNRKIIIKGGPGTGKSRMIRRVAEHYEGMGKSVEYIHCSSDPDSLDGIIVDELGVCVADRQHRRLLGRKGARGRGGSRSRSAQAYQARVQLRLSLAQGR